MQQIRAYYAQPGPMTELGRTLEEDPRAQPLQSWSDVGGPP